MRAVVHECVGWVWNECGSFFNVGGMNDGVDVDWDVEVCGFRLGVREGEAVVVGWCLIRFGSEQRVLGRVRGGGCVERGREIGFA